ncbi:MAG: MFS transporter [Defluviitaleaceae bacterium]|nr:MFS transporter [Defluviitaleaceae bacterium]
MLINKNFTKLLFGDSISNLSGALSSLVVVWAITQHENGIFWVGVYYAAMRASDLFAFLFGNLVDRVSNKKILVFTELGAMIIKIMFTLALLFNMYLGFNLPLVLSIIVFFLGIIENPTYSVKHAYTQKAVEKKDLEKVSSYNYMARNIGSNLFNPVIGFLMNHILHIYILISSIITHFIATLFYKNLEDLKIEKDVKIDRTNKKKESIFIGFKYLFKDNLLTLILIEGSLLNIFFAGVPIYFAIIASYHNSPFILGLLGSIMSFGGLVGAVFVTRVLFKNIPLGKKNILLRFLLGLSLALTFLFVEDFSILIILAIAGVFWGSTHITGTPVDQAIIPKEHFGKIRQAMYTISVGIMPLGSLFFGIMSEHISLSLFFILFGSTYIFFSILMFFNKRMRELSLEN